MNKRKSTSIKRRVFTIARWIHVYISVALFALLILFSVSGILLNHSEWLNGRSTDGEVNVELNSELIQTLRLESVDFFQAPPTDTLQQLLRERFRLGKITDISIDEDAGEVLLDYKLPAGYATAILMVSEQQLLLEYRKGSFWQIVNDLHKGRHSGIVWSWVIDVSAALMIVFSMAGLLLIFQGRKYRPAGVWVTVLGVFSPLVLYIMCVPRLSGVG